MPKQLNSRSLGQERWQALIDDVILALDTEAAPDGALDYRTMSEAIGMYLAESWHQGILQSEWGIEQYTKEEAWKLTTQVTKAYLDAGRFWPIERLGTPEDINVRP